VPQLITARAQAVTDAVFVDRTGRRRRRFTMFGLGLAGALIAGCALLVVGLTGTPAPAPGLPPPGQGVMRDGVGPPGVQRPPSDDSGAATPTRTSQPTHTPAVPAATAGRLPLGPSPLTSSSATATTTSPARPGNGRTSHPANPKPTRSK
jgi:hypothetical protein